MRGASAQTLFAALAKVAYALLSPNVLSAGVIAALCLLSPHATLADPSSASAGSPFQPPSMPPGTTPEDVTRGLGYTFWASTSQWYAGGMALAQHIFITFATLEFIWYSIRAALRRQELPDYLTGFFLKFLTLMFFWWVVTNAGVWVPAVINTFKAAAGIAQCGPGAATCDVTSLYDPVTMLLKGLDLTVKVLNLGGVKFLLGATALSPSALGMAGLVVLAALVELIAFVVGAGQLLIVQIEAYIVCTAGLILLGFTGASWTLPYAQKFVGYVATVGFKFFLLMLLVAGLGQNLANYWSQHFDSLLNVPGSAQSAAGSAAPAGGYAWMTPQYDSYIQAASASNNVSADLVKAVIQQESGGDPNIVSKTGAMGLMQLMPATAAGCGAINPFDPAQNIDCGTAYLSNLLKTTGSVAGALAAYNGGSGACYTNGFSIPGISGGTWCAETVNYVNSIMGWLGTSFAELTGQINLKGVLTFLASFLIFLLVALTAPAMAGAIMSGSPSLGLANVANFAGGIVGGAWGASVQGASFTHEMGGYDRKIVQTQGRLDSARRMAGNRAIGGASAFAGGAGAGGAGAAGASRVAAAAGPVGIGVAALGMAAGAATKAVGGSMSSAGTKSGAASAAAAPVKSKPQGDGTQRKSVRSPNRSASSGEAAARINAARERTQSDARARSGLSAAGSQHQAPQDEPSRFHSVAPPGDMPHGNAPAGQNRGAKQDGWDLSKLESSLTDLHHDRKSLLLKHLGQLQPPSLPTHADGHTMHLPIKHAE